jgi:outer membrane protein assembly factor BamD (BamD/ComL family)
MKAHHIKCIVILQLFFAGISVSNMAVASEEDIINLAGSYYNNNEYYNAISETMRYQYLYPEGVYYPGSLILMANAYYKGDNYYKATETLTICYERFKNTSEGGEALLNLGNLRLMKGSPYFACRTFQEYQYIYSNGKFKEDVLVNMSYAQVLTDDFEGALKSINDYHNNYPDGKYSDDVNQLKSLVNEEINKPKKNVWVSVTGSIFIPGFGHFYAGKNITGIVSFLSNAALIYLFCDAYKDDNKFRMLVFGMGELTFYQYSLYSAISNVYEYNSKENFRKSVKLGIITKF